MLLNPWILTAAVSFILFILYCSRFEFRKQESLSNQVHVARHLTSFSNRSGPKLNPRNFFIDLGANNGKSVDYFLQGEQKKGNVAESGGHAGSKLNGLGSDGTWHIVAVEANYRFTNQLHERAAKFLGANLVKSFTVYNGTAIGDHDGTLSLWWDGRDQPHEGFSEMSGTESHLNYNKSEQVPLMDIVTLFRNHHIHARDQVVMKLDIEGSEYAVIKRLLVAGLLPLVDILAVEWHHGGYIQKDPKKGEELTKQKECLTNWLLYDNLQPKLEEWGR